MRLLGKQFATLICCMWVCSAWAQQSTIRIGIEHWPPLQVLEESGEFSGLDVDLAKAIASQAGVGTEFYVSPWRRLLVELEKGNLDVLLAATKTPERTRFAVFSSTPMRYGYNGLFIGKHSAFAHQEFANLNDILNINITLAVTRGNAYSKDYQTLIEQPEFTQKLIPVKDEMSKLKLLATRRIDGFLGGLFSTAYAIQQDYPNDFASLKLVLHDANESGAYLMYSKASMNQETINKLDQAIVQLRESGQSKIIVNRYLRKLNQPETVFLPIH